MQLKSRAEITELDYDHIFFVVREKLKKAIEKHGRDSMVSTHEISGKFVKNWMSLKKPLMMMI
jgi:hypothetical protein